MNLTLAVVSGDALISALIWLVIIAVIFWILQWVITTVGVPEPFNKVLKVIMILVAALICINVLLSLAGHPLVKF